MHTHLIGILAILLYLASSSLLVARMVRGLEPGAGGRNSVIGLGFAGVVLHAVVLWPALVTASGLNLGFFNAASLIALLSAALLLLASLYRPLENLGVLLLPVAALTIALMFAYSTEHIILDQSSWQLDLHVLISVIAYSVLGLAALQALLLAVQEHQLRHHRLGGILQVLPPLRGMDLILMQLIGVGFALLTLALVTGVLFLEDIFAQHLVHKTVLSIIAWAVFGVLLWGHWRFGWRGRTAIRWTLGGFIFLMLSYFGTKLVLEILLRA
ncbi:inner membrane protein YpjD [Thiohalobacter sp. COW1]|uniref:cytochrome C assembly family protein n=1 Tax=Thiohalobacter sp. COW1 TaxID=2795687 RepID=UPI0019166AC4|nr:cytochrome c biogenesis protein CcsA [Thiohalobacter sp. COW1]BCO33233.1 inner membrane protein YpjD [Thiohalobacter sp. COW1]